MKTFRAVREYYLTCRIEHGVRRSVQLTAAYFNLTADQVCDRIGLARRYAEEKKWNEIRQELNALLIRRKGDSERIRELMPIAFPKGSTINYYRGWRRKLLGRAIYLGEVIEHGYGERLKVKNKNTGNILWITLSDVVEHSFR